MGRLVVAEHSANEIETNELEPLETVLRKRQARLLTRVLQVSAAITALAIGMLVVWPDMVPEGALPEVFARNIVALGIVGVLLGLVKRGHVRETAWIMIVVVLSLVPYTIYMENAENLQMLMLLAFPVVVAGLLLNRGQFWVVFALCAATSTGTFWMMSARLDAPLDSRNITSHMMVLTLFAFMVDGLSRAYYESLVQGARQLIEVRAGHEALEEANERLRLALDERDRAEAERREHETIERLALAAARAGTWKLDLRSGVTNWSDQMWRLVGWAPQDEAPSFENYSRIIRAEDRGKVADYLIALFQSPDHRNEVLYRIVRSDGDTRWIQSLGEFRTDENGDPSHFAGVALDVTQQVEERVQQEEIEEREHESQRLESLGLLAGSIAHDFNNLLQVIIFNTQLLRRRVEEFPASEPYLEDMDVAARRAAELCTELLAYSGKGQVDVRPFRLDEIVKEMSRILEITLPKNTTIDYQFSDAHPVAQCDAAQMRQIVMNLITNAAESGYPGLSNRISIATGVVGHNAEDLASMRFAKHLMPGAYAYIEVSDRGRGMEPDIVRRMFEPFYTTKTDGHGLGMSAVLGIIRAHEGTIDVSSAPGAGTMVRVLLPLSHETPDPIRLEEPVAFERANRETILFVDDEAQICALAEQTLVNAAFKVVTAPDGDAGVRVFEEHRDDIAAVVLDVIMPGKSGVEVFRILRENAPEVPVILSSGYAYPESTTDLLSEGLAGFLKKPYQPQELVNAIQNVLSPTSS